MYLVTVIEPFSSSSIQVGKIEWNNNDMWVRREEVSSSTILWIQGGSGGSWTPHTEYPSSYKEFLSHLSHAISSSLLSERNTSIDILQFSTEDSTLLPTKSE